MRDLEIAQVAYSANRVTVMLQQDPAVPVPLAWVALTDEQRQEYALAVAGARGATTAEAQHELWCRARRAAGWRFGPVKDNDQLLHPNLLPWSELPPGAQDKARLFQNVVRAFVPAEVHPS